VTVNEFRLVPSLARVRTSFAAHWRSRLALGFALVHTVAFLVIIFSETPDPPESDTPCEAGPGEGCMDLWNLTGVVVAGRFFHHQVAFKWLSLADLPALVADAGVGALLHLVGLSFSRLTDSYVHAWVWFLFGTIQWWLYGIAVRTAQVRRRTSS
jgi:hypothetical protein